DRVRVVERVEVVVARGLVVRRLAEPRPDLRALAEVDVGPLGGVQRVRPDEEPGVPEHAAASSQTFDPAADEIDLVPRDEAGRADVEDDRPVCAQTDVAAELLAGAARLALEPRVAERRARQADAPLRDAVQLARLLRLEIVPDEYGVGRVAEQALV